MTWPGTEPRSAEPLANALPTRPMNRCVYRRPHLWVRPFFSVGVQCVLFISLVSDCTAADFLDAASRNQHAATSSSSRCNRFVKVRVVQLYISSDTTTAWKYSRFILSEILDFFLWLTTYRQQSIPFIIRILTSPTVVNIFLAWYEKWYTTFRRFSFNVEMAPPPTHTKLFSWIVYSGSK